MITGLREYQQQAMKTCTKSSNNLLYMLFNLQGEVGELSGKIAKLIRKGKAWFDIGEERDCISDVENTVVHDFQVLYTNTDEFNDIVNEIGDCLWQVAGVCSVLGLDLEVVANKNLDKLSSRQERGVIVGDGDNR